MSNLPALPTNNAPALDPLIVQQLSTWEDYVSYYLQLDEAASTFAWWKADLLLSLYSRFGGNSLEQFANEVRVPRGTVINYVRTSRAFPSETRIPMLSFSHHFNASYADAYDDKTMEFSGTNRFDFLEKAADNTWSTRQLKGEIDRDKKLKALDAIIIPCEFCKNDEGEILTFAVYCSKISSSPDKLDLHPACWATIMEFITNHGA